MRSLSNTFVIISDPAPNDYGPARPPILLSKKLSENGYKVFFVSPRIGPLVQGILDGNGILPIDFKIREIFKDSSKNMFFLWTLDELLSNISHYVEFLLKNIPRENAIVLNFSNLARVPSHVWYCQGPFTHAFADMDWRYYSPAYLVASRFVYPFLKLFDKRHIMEMRRLAQVLIANSKFTSSMYEDFGIKPDYIIYPPLETSLFRPTTNSPSEDYVLTYVGKETDFDALLSLSRKGIKIKAFGSKRRSIPRSLIKRKNFEFLGHVNTEELIDLYSNALFTLFPFTHEPFGYIPLESLSCGTPVLTYNKQGPREVVMHGENGWLAKSREELIRIALKIWREGYPSRMRSNSRSRALLFDISKVYSKWLQILSVLAP